MGMGASKQISFLYMYCGIHQIIYFIISCLIIILYTIFSRLRGFEICFDKGVKDFFHSSLYFLSVFYQLSVQPVAKWVLLLVKTQNICRIVYTQTPLSRSSNIKASPCQGGLCVLTSCYEKHNEMHAVKWSHCITWHVQINYTTWIHAFTIWMLDIQTEKWRKTACNSAHIKIYWEEEKKNW